MSARSLNPATGLGTAAGSPSHTAIDVNFTPGSNPAGTTYTVTRDKKKDGTAGPEVACSGLTSSPCQDTGLTASTTYTYTVKAMLSGWSKPTSGSVSRTTAATPATLTITSRARSGGSKKVTFSGTGAVPIVAGTNNVVVTICTVNTWPCAAPHSSATATTATAGAWTTAQSGPANLADGVTYYARAKQGLVESATFEFTVTGI